MTISTLSVHDEEYYLCDICAFNGYPNEKVILVIHGFKDEEEDGFVYLFTEYQYDAIARGDRIKHIHKYSPELIQEYVDLALKIRNSG